MMLKPKTPPAWSSLPGQPVRLMILLAIRAAQGGTTHMQVLAKLARKIMDEDFRAQITTETDPAPLRALLQNVF